MNKVEVERILDNVQKAITDITTHVGKINKRLDELEERINKMSKDNSQVDLLSDDIEELRERIDGFEDLKLSNRVTDIENIIYRLRDALEVR